jgi:hypothetical protein
MGYLDNSTVTVDAILTNKGRQILAAGGQLDIRKFALSDDEIDYTLWNPSHTLGSNYYGAVIEAMPVVEANPDETQMMRYKLVTLPKDVSGIPVISVNPSSATLQNQNDSVTLDPSTLNYETGNRTLGYTAILNDDSVAMLEVAPGGNIAGVGFDALGNAIAGLASGVSTGVGVTNFLDDEVNGITTAGSSVTRVGTKFTVKAKQSTADKYVLVTIIGNETGGFQTVSIRIRANTSSTLGVVNAPSGS